MIIIVGQYMGINEKVGVGGSKNSLQRPFVQSRYGAPAGWVTSGGGASSLSRPGREGWGGNLNIGIALA